MLRLVRVLGVICLVVVMGTAAAAGERKFVGKFGHTAATVSVVGEIAAEFGKRVNARGTALEIQVFPDSQLGGTQTLIESVMIGNVQLANAGYGSLGAFVPELGALELPFIFGDRLDIDRILKVTSSPLYEEWQKMLATQKGLRVAAPAWYYGHRDILVKKAATKPEDLRGQKIRVVPAPLYVEIMKALGAVPTPVDWPETYNALKQGVIDGVDAATDGLIFMKFYEGAKHYLRTHHITGLNAMIANAKWYSSLPPAEKQALDEELVWFQKQVGDRMTAAEPGVIKDLATLGVTISQIDVAAFKQAVERARVAEKVAEAQKWRPDTLQRFRTAVKEAGF
jgi:TRAP-type C4-dicarboxylate transport system substrate-binding protein